MLQEDLIFFSPILWLVAGGPDEAAAQREQPGRVADEPAGEALHSLADRPLGRGQLP